ncbi:MAG TPA: hypothetical protein VIK55_02710 [Paludibacter sp.]
MSIRFSVISLFLIVQFSLFAQELQWKAGLNYFFDNTEFAKSNLTKDQTMTGVHFSPELGIKWDSVHAIFVGSDLLKTSGSQNIIDKIDLIAYYQYHSPKVLFRAGAFQRNELLSNYSDLFFQDSINYYDPIMHGIFWKFGQSKAYFNLWLDWNGHQTDINRETFYIGASAHKRFGYLFADFQSYMYHFSNTRPSNPTYHVCDNVLAHLSLGVDYSNKFGLDTLLFAVGILGGYERERGIPDIINTPLGAVIRFNVEYRGIGLNNTLYVGDPRMVLYNKYGGNLYWSNPFLRSNSYFESKLYLNVIHTREVQGKLSSNFHFSENKLMFEQVFTLSVSLNNFSKLNKKSIFY